ncbi:hypothetical protein GHK92_02855 [Nocardioides sp. dk4132]|uniref:hypothetical protein n=1 Tax=unclassified Nocardioides TaxID=2615069 RepID=UPI00129643AE|nr:MULTISPECIES: hypothetical protein [unclassified Nocardioides]MQW74802.1 hypothetical protein [Nocardioides sp. dk4132]QGA06694.1 hypothetical protein GFH29_04290 [Nocardioides sp. dk884]
MKLQFGRRFLVVYVLGVLCLGAIVIATLREDTGQPLPGPVAASLSAGASRGADAGVPGGGPDGDPTGGGAAGGSGQPPGAPPSDGSDPGPGGIEAAPGPDLGAGPGSGEPRGSGPGRRRDPVVRGVAAPESADGALVAGHPRRVLPPVPGTRVRTSSVSPSPGRLQVTFSAEGSDADRVLAFYRVHLAGLGFREVSGRAASGTEAAFFAWRASSVVITAVPEDGSYAVFAILRARRA